ncbi:hypothetical protein HK104_004547, partial [Borealophlyctis nickersoniae]
MEGTVGEHSCRNAGEQVQHKPTNSTSSFSSLYNHITSSALDIRHLALRRPSDASVTSHGSQTSYRQHHYDGSTSSFGSFASGKDSGVAGLSRTLDAPRGSRAEDGGRAARAFHEQHQKEDKLNSGAEEDQERAGGA